MSGACADVFAVDFELCVSQCLDSEPACVPACFDATDSSCLDLECRDDADGGTPSLHSGTLVNIGEVSAEETYAHGYLGGSRYTPSPSSTLPFLIQSFFSCVLRSIMFSPSLLPSVTLFSFPFLPIHSSFLPYCSTKCTTAYMMGPLLLTASGFDTRRISKWGSLPRTSKNICCAAPQTHI